MKLIQVDGYQRDTVADILILEGLDKENSETVLEAHLKRWGSDSIWFRVVDDNYVLSRGMEDLI